MAQPDESRDDAAAIRIARGSLHCRRARSQAHGRAPDPAIPPDSAAPADSADPRAIAEDAERSPAGSTPPTRAADTAAAPPRAHSAATDAAACHRLQSHPAVCLGPSAHRADAATPCEPRATAQRIDARGSATDAAAEVQTLADASCRDAAEPAQRDERVQQRVQGVELELLVVVAARSVLLAIHARAGHAVATLRRLAAAARPADAPA